MFDWAQTLLRPRAGSPAGVETAPDRPQDLKADPAAPRPHQVPTTDGVDAAQKVPIQAPKNVLCTDETPVEALLAASHAEALPPISPARIEQIGRLAGDHPAFTALSEQLATQLGQQQPLDAVTDAQLSDTLALLMAEIPALRRAPSVAGGPGEDAPPANFEHLQSNVVGLVLSAMLLAFKSGNEDKRVALRKAEMYNQMLARLNRYVSDVLMRAQRKIGRANELLAQQRDHKGRQNQASVVIDGVIDDFNTDFAPRDPVSGAYEPLLRVDPLHGGSRQLTQLDLQVLIDQAGQWRQSIMNNQQKQTSMFQGVDAQQTSFLQMLGSTLKGVNDTALNLARNLHS